jgi:hypothetical protein
MDNEIVMNRLRECAYRRQSDGQRARPLQPLDGFVLISSVVRANQCERRIDDDAMRRLEDIPVR